MAKRDPEKTARNKIIDQLTEELKEIESGVLRVTKFDNVLSLNAKIGSKHAHFIDIENEVIHSADHFCSLYMEGYLQLISKDWRTIEYSNDKETFDLLKKHKIFREYLYIFLKRTYLRNYEALSKKRPKAEDAEIWIGQENANYGLLVTPRFVNSKWENDKSEIRHFKPKYWTIGHVLETGLLIPNENERMTFKNSDEYLNFFKNVLVRNSGSIHETKIAKKYTEFVRSSSNPLDVPLLIPEFRYGGLAKKHKYRLDFTIIDPVELNKIGFEFSPWSSHGYLAKTSELNQKQINELAKDNFESEMKKHKDYFKRHGIFVLIYTDTDLKNIDVLFEDIEAYLKPKNIGTQLKFHIIEEYFK